MLSRDKVACEVSGDVNRSCEVYQLSTYQKLSATSRSSDNNLVVKCQVYASARLRPNPIPLTYVHSVISLYA